MIKTGPCKGCERRKVGCQGKCKDYKAFLEDYRARVAYCGASEADMYLAIRKRRYQK